MIRPSIAIAWLCTALHTSLGFHFEISLADQPGHNGTVHIKLACRPSGQDSRINGNQSVLWEGSQFGTPDRLALATSGQLMVPDIRVNSSDRFRCSLMSPPVNRTERRLLRRRILRRLRAAIPAKFGSCPPGYRIDQELCYPCLPGTYSSGEDTLCYLCPKHFYMSKEGGDSCWPCPEGRKTLAEGADSEDSCLAVDKDGKPYSEVSTKWLVIGICIAITILTGVIIAVIWMLYFKKQKSKPKPRLKPVVKPKARLQPKPRAKTKKKITEKPKRKKKELRVITRKELEAPVKFKRSADDHIYESISDQAFNDDNQHIYDNIGAKDEDGYEVPITRGKLAKNSPKKPGNINTIDEDGYEVPITRGKRGKKQSKKPENIYMELLSDEEEHIYEEPIKLIKPSSPKSSKAVRPKLPKRNR